MTAPIQDNDMILGSPTPSLTWCSCTCPMVCSSDCWRIYLDKGRPERIDQNEGHVYEKFVG